MNLVKVELADQAFFWGNLLQKNADWIALQAIDDNYVLDGITMIKSTIVKHIKTDFSEKDRADVHDYYNFSKLTETYGKLSFNEFIRACKNSLISLETQAGTSYQGKLIEISNGSIKLTEFRDYVLEPYALEIPLTDIQVMSCHSIDLETIAAWLDHQGSDESSDLIEIHLDHYGDKRVDESAIGKVVAENSKYALVEVITDQGQFASYTVFNKDYATHVSENNATLRFLTFAKNYQLANGNYDPHQLAKQVPQLDDDLAKMLTQDKVITLDAYDYTANNQGIITKVGDDFLELMVFDEDDQPSENQSFAYKDLVSIDLVNYLDSALLEDKNSESIQK